ncbi:hypothetical protein [Scytonema sp. NUACC26]|uniref:hypothetical protein n=1 Tax=Scytonema sp. NUACC26 TaxID=3140176 RepID=UPI0034DC22D1
MHQRRGCVHLRLIHILYVMKVGIAIYEAKTPLCLTVCSISPPLVCRIDLDQLFVAFFVQINLK